MIPPLHGSMLFPYTTLFRSRRAELGAPTSTVSRAVGRLESRGGVRLLQRTTRHVRPTTEGRELYAAVAPAVSTLRADRKSTRLNSSHLGISYAVFCLKKKTH